LALPLWHALGGLCWRRLRELRALVRVRQQARLGLRALVLTLSLLAAGLRAIALILSRRWMLDAKVGQLRLQAGLPAGWRIAHKTGTYDDQTNDVGIIWPPDRAPIIVAALYNRGGTRQKQREGALREGGRIVATSL
jgi:beta-lactamase class A